MEKTNLSLENLPQPIKDMLLKKANDDSYEPMPNNFSITDLLYCIRKKYFQKTLPKKQVDLKSANNFFRGNLWDNVFCSQFKRNQIRCTYRCRNIPISISGKFDFLDENNILTDLKSPSDLYYVITTNKTSESYRKQVLFYCYCNAIPQGQVMYWDGSKCLKIPVEVTEENCKQLIEEVESKAFLLWFALEHNKPPAREVCSPEDWECKYCSYQEDCNNA